MNPNFMKTLWKGWKPIDWLDVSVTDTVFKYPTHIQQQVEEQRAIKYAEEIAKGKKMRDSDLYRVNTIEISDDVCRLQLGLMKWSELFVIKYIPGLGEKLDEKSYSNGIAVSALIETSDGYFVFGIRGSGNAGRTGGELAVVGGTLEKFETEVSDYQGLYNHVLTELKEEIGIGEQYIQDAKFVGINRMSNGGTGFMYYLSLGLSKEECRTQFDLENDGEFQDLKFLSSNVVIGSLKDICFENGVIKRTLGLSVDYLEEIFRHTS